MYLRDAVTARLLAYLLLRDQIGLQVAGEGAQLLGDHLVAADQVVVEQHRGNRDEQTEAVMISASPTGPATLSIEA